MKKNVKNIMSVGFWKIVIVLTNLFRTIFKTNTLVILMSKKDEHLFEDVHGSRFQQENCLHLVSCNDHANSKKILVLELKVMILGYQ